MPESYEALPKRRLLRVAALIILGLLFIARIGYTQTQTNEQKQSILQALIQIQPTQPLAGDPTRIQPGTPVKLLATIENKGNKSSPAGQLYIRYVFAPPLDKEATSLLFETEKKPLPEIEPGKSIEIAFDAPHTIPSLLDFIRQDWLMREYQAVAVMNQEEHCIGSLALTFSAYYYPGIKKEFPTKI